SYYTRSAQLKYLEADFIGLSNTFNNMASSFIQEKQFGKAKHYLDSSLLLSRNYGFKNNTVEIYKTYYELEFAQQHFELALKYYKEYVAQKDSIERTEKTLAINKLQALYELEKAQTQLMDQKADLKSAYFTRFVSFLAVLLMILLCFY